MKLLRTIRLDPSDTFIFPEAAEPGEWAVTGTFMFADQNPETLEGKARAAFRAGFLGAESLGWSTLVQIVNAADDDRAAAVEVLARQLVVRLGAPDMETARVAAAEEIDFAASLCDHHQPNMLIAIHRSHEGGAIREQFRSLRPKGGPKPLKVFEFLEATDEDDGPQETVDLAALAREEGKP